jgi:hypothetical protein
MFYEKERTNDRVKKTAAGAASFRRTRRTKAVILALVLALVAGAAIYTYHLSTLTEN